MTSQDGNVRLGLIHRIRPTRDDAKFYFREFRDGFYYDAQNDLWMLEFAGKTKCLTDGDWVFLSSNTNVIHENPEALPLREVERIALRMITIATD
ncbi:hypothetical protein RQ64_20915 [Acinetobacter baumannii]|nr:hypothetical protein RQ64_20915 [Acinetobacter baumannii]